MALGEGTLWNESEPADSNLANQIDDYMRECQVGVRKRMANEHIWPSTQTGTGQAGHHNFVTLQTQTGAPSLVAASGQVGCVYVGSSGAGYPLMFENSAGSTITLVNSACQIPVVTTGTLGSIPICSSANPSGLTLLVASAPGMVLHTNTNTGAPTWAKVNLSDSNEVTGTGITALKSYDSGWFSASKASKYTKTHGLGTTLFIASVYFSTSSDGSNAYQEGTVGNNHANPDVLCGTVLKNIGTSTVDVVTGGHALSEHVTDSGNYGDNPESGYLRVVLLSLT